MPTASDDGIKIKFRSWVTPVPEWLATVPVDWSESKCAAFQWFLYGFESNTEGNSVHTKRGYEIALRKFETFFECDNV